MRTLKLLLLTLVLISAQGALRAQNSDLAFLLGVTSPVAATKAGGVDTASVGFSFAIDYAIQLKETRAGQLFLDLPVLIALNSTDVSFPSAAVNSVATQVYFTPGVRWKFTPANRISFYATGGAGIAGTAHGENVSTQTTASSYLQGGVMFALGAGAGVDFRLTRLLSVRAEGRDEITSARILGAYNHGFFMLGLGFHF